MQKLLLILAIGLFVAGCSPREDLEDTIPAGRVAAMVAEEAKQQGVPVRLALAVAETESRFNPQARSPAGAMGVMQIMPGTWRGLGCSGSPWSARDNIRCGVAYLKQGLDEGGPHYAAARYNGGPGGAGSAYARRYASLVLQRAGLEPSPVRIAAR